MKKTLICSISCSVLVAIITCFVVITITNKNTENLIREANATVTQGPKGDDGKTGEQGQKGDQGPQGEKGDKGPAGPAGKPADPNELDDLEKSIDEMTKLIETVNQSITLLEKQDDKNIDEIEKVKLVLADLTSKIDSFATDMSKLRADVQFAKDEANRANQRIDNMAT